jgi:AcrR family transcriptional regulator
MSTPADKHDALIAAALDLFERRGFHGTTVPELAQHAGVATGTVYRYFESKEALVNALYQRSKRQLSAALAEAVASSPSWRGRFRAVWFALFHFSRAHPKVIAFLDLHTHADYLDEASKAVEAETAVTLFALIVGGQNDEAFTELPPAAALAMVYGAFLGLLRAEREGYLELTPELIESTEARAWAQIRR